MIELIKMMNIASMLLLDELLSGIQDYVLGFLPDTGVNCGSIPDLVEGLILAEEFQLESIKDALVLELYRSLDDVPHIPDVVQNSESFKRLPANLLKDVILCGDTDMIESNLPSVKNEFDAFMFWLSENEISEDDKREIAKHLECDLDDFTPEELLTDVKNSGLFSMKMIDYRVIKFIQDKDRHLKANDRMITNFLLILKDKDRELKAKDKTISKKRKEVDMLKEENKKLKMERIRSRIK